MHLPDPIAAARRGLSVALLAALISPVATAAAQDLLPRVEVRQVGDLRWGWNNEARVKLDRDAFLVVVEFGADGRLRVVYPQRPDQSAYTKSNRPIYAELPSSDAMFIRASWVRVPTVIAFASDVAPDLSSFSSDGKTWEFEYNVADNAGEREVVNALAEVLYGSMDMPFSIATTRSAPMLSAFAISTLNSCGYPLGGNIANDFNNFLWELYGPIAIGSRRFQFGDYGSNWNRNLFLSTYMPFPFSSFQRSINGGLWNRYGAGCPGLSQQAPLYFIASVDRPVSPPTDSIGDVTPPKDRDGKPPKVVDDVELVPASPAAIERRSSAVKNAATKVATATGGDNGVAQRSERSELVQRSQVAQAIAMLNARNALGMDGTNARSNQRRGWVRTATSGGSGGYGGSGTITRASGSGSGGGSTGVGTSSGSGGSSSVGSGASSGASRGGEGRAGTTGSGRGGTGRPDPSQP